MSDGERKREDERESLTEGEGGRRTKRERGRETVVNNYCYNVFRSTFN